MVVQAKDENEYTALSIRSLIFMFSMEWLLHHDRQGANEMVRLTSAHVYMPMSTYIDMPNLRYKSVVMPLQVAKSFSSVVVYQVIEPFVIRHCLSEFDSTKLAHQVKGRYRSEAPGLTNIPTSCPPSLQWPSSILSLVSSPAGRPSTNIS